MKIGKTMLFAVCLLVIFCAWAQAGWNGVTVATEGKGVYVYASSGAKDACGILYNGYDGSLSLEETNDRYSCFLTVDYTVWLNQKKAQEKLPKDHWSMSAEEMQIDSGIFLAEVVAEEAPLYTTPGHKHLTARHLKGTLMKVCGEFGDDYYVEDGGICGFVPKTSVQKYRELSYAESYHNTSFAVETKTVFTNGDDLLLNASATGYADSDARKVENGTQVKVLRYLGDWAQLTAPYYGNFIQTRFLDPHGNHEIDYAVVKSSERLNRLNVRSFADADASVIVKLCAGAKVQVSSRTEDWASVYIGGPGDSTNYFGVVQLEYLAFGEEAENAESGCARVRLTKDVFGGNQGREYRASWDGEKLPAGTEMTVVGVETHWEFDAEYPDRFVCMLDDGRLIVIWNDGGVLEPMETFGITAKAASNVRMREKPTTEAAALRTLSKGTKVEVLLRGEIWTMVKYKEQTGYVMSRYLQFP